MRDALTRLFKLWLPAISVAALVLAIGLAFTARMRAQQEPPAPPPAFPSAGNPDDSHDPALLQIKERQALQQNEERQQQLVKDTDKLLELATELKNEVDKTNKNVLSVEVIKKASEIEKLAKSVREKMKAE